MTQRDLFIFSFNLLKITLKEEKDNRVQTTLCFESNLIFPWQFQLSGLLFSIQKLKEPV
jgi:hypothetical protein